MEKSRGSNVNAAGSSIPVTQGSMAPSGKTQTGKAVQCKAGVQILHPVAVTSNTSRRTTSDYEVAVTCAPGFAWETLNAEKPGRLEVRECEYKPTTDELPQAVQDSLDEMKKCQERKKDPASFCMVVSREMDRLKNRYKIDDAESNDYKFMIWQLAPYYVGSLRPALEIMKRQVDNGCGWEYHTEIGPVGKYLDLQTNEASDTSDNRKLLEELYLNLIYSEMSYLEFMTNFPLKCIVDNSRIIMGELLSEKCGAPGYHFISKRKRKRILKQKENLIQLIEANLAKDGADKDIDQLEKDMCRETDATKAHLIKRRYNDLLKEIFVERKAEYHQLKYIGTTEYISFITDLSDLFVKCTSRIGELHLLPRDITKEMIDATKIQLNNHLYRGVRLEEKILILIDDLLDKEMLNEKCGKLCLYCKELEFPPQVAMRTPVQTSEITDRQFRNRLAGMNLILENEPEARKVADKLRELFYEHSHEINALDMKDPDANHIINLRKKLHQELFSPLIQEFHEYQNQAGVGRERFADAKRLFRSRLVTLIPYTFVLINEKERAALTNLACAVWHGDVETLSQAVSFRKEDVDCLLDLKRISPYIPDQPLRPVLEKALANVFRFVLQDTGGEIPVEKIAVLSQWVDGLNRVKHVDDPLKICHEQWKATNKAAASKKRNRVSSDAPSISVPVPDIDQEMLESVALKGKPATAGVVSAQSVPEVALSRPVPEEPSIVKKSRLSLVPAEAEKASVAEAVGSGVISP